MRQRMQLCELGQIGDALQEVAATPYAGRLTGLSARRITRRRRVLVDEKIRVLSPPPFRPPCIGWVDKWGINGRPVFLFNIQLRYMLLIAAIGTCSTND